MAKGLLKIGTEIIYRGSFGQGMREFVTIESITYKDGDDEEEVNAIPFKCKNDCTFTLSNGHWCYGNQIDAVCEDGIQKL